MKFVLIAVLAVCCLTGCGEPARYECVTSAACDVGPGGLCEPDGRCSYEDDRCRTGRRYGDLAGDRRGECVIEDDRLGDAGVVDAGLSLDAAACSVDQPNLLGNAGFDDPAVVPWIERSDLGYGLTYDQGGELLAGTVDADSPTRFAWQGGVTSLTDDLTQVVAIPPGTTGLALRGVFRSRTDETAADARDTLVLTLRDASGAVLEELGRFSNLDAANAAGWQPFAFVPTASRAGQSIRLVLASANDAAAPTDFFVDSLVLEATACE